MAQVVSDQNSNYTIVEDTIGSRSIRHVTVTTNWEGYMPVKPGHRSYEMRVEPIRIPEGETVLLDVVCSELKNATNGLTNSKPSWNCTFEQSADDMDATVSIIDFTDLTHEIKWNGSRRGDTCEQYYGTRFRVGENTNESFVLNYELKVPEVSHAVVKDQILKLHIPIEIERTEKN